LQVVVAFSDASLFAALQRSPTAPLLAVGTMAGAVDLSFSATACLEVCLHASRLRRASC
jgi:hypothetical protein